MSLEGLFLIFAMNLAPTPGLNYGKLSLVDGKTGIIREWKATSGVERLQNPGDWNTPRGGVIPPNINRSPKGAFYQVDTKSVDLNWHPGVRGTAYPISPYWVTTDKGGKRGDLLIHPDARYPGTLGCIGIPPEQWGDFTTIWKSYTKGKTTVPMLVIYN